jgi:hypothetical protein
MFAQPELNLKKFLDKPSQMWRLIGETSMPRQYGMNQDYTSLQQTTSVSNTLLRLNYFNKP